MKKSGISQLPVYTGTRLVGSITENQIVTAPEHRGRPREASSASRCRVDLQPSFPIVSTDTPIEALFSLFKFVPAVLVATGDKVEGIITKIDMLSAEVDNADRRTVELALELRSNLLMESTVGPIRTANTEARASS